MKTIALFGYYGVGNLGDEAVVETLVENIKTRCPDAKLYGISLNPDDTRRRHGIEAFPIRRMYFARTGEDTSWWGKLQTVSLIRKITRVISILFVKIPAEILFLIRSYTSLRGIDILVVAGSGGIYDWWYGPWSHPLTHFKWALLAKASGTQMVYMSVGAGPINTKLGKFFLKFALGAARYRSFRDEASRQLVTRIGTRGEHHVYPDMAFGITVKKKELSNAQNTSRLVGINPVPFFHSSWATMLGTSEAKYEGYVNTIAGFIAWLLEGGHRVAFFHSQTGDEFLDADIMKAFHARQGTSSDPRITQYSATTFDVLLKQISGLDIVVASRFHAVLFSYIAHKPVLGISYHQKIDDLMSDFGQTACNVQIEHLALDDLTKRFATLEESISLGNWNISEGILEKYRPALDEQYDRLFGKRSLTM